MRYQEYFSEAKTFNKNNPFHDSTEHHNEYCKRERNMHIKFCTELPDLLKDPEFRESFINDKTILNTGKLTLSLFEEALEYYLNANKNNATKVLAIIFADEDIKNKFLYENIKLDFLLMIICKHRPDSVTFFLRDTRLIDTLKNKFSLVLVAGLLSLSCNRKDADYVFGNEQIFGEYNAERRRKIYGRICENFENFHPTSLQSLSLFAVANNPSIDRNSLSSSQDIQFKNPLADEEDSGDESELLAKDWGEPYRHFSNYL